MRIPTTLTVSPSSSMSSSVGLSVRLPLEFSWPADMVMTKFATVALSVVPSVPPPTTAVTSLPVPKRMPVSVTVTSAVLEPVSSGTEFCKLFLPGSASAISVGHTTIAADASLALCDG
ncbi:MAG: hypothetical protein OXQ84_04665 [bacterium]|nr:hypothetical protein [bacterium]